MKQVTCEQHSACACVSAYVQELEARLNASDAVIQASHDAVAEILSQKRSWPGEVDTLADELEKYKELKEGH